MAGDYTVFVNSTDSFEDTWEPFFGLLHEFWPEASSVILNTETKSYTHSQIDVTATTVARSGERRVPWGECMARALEHIPTEQFVYLQDDYFLCAPVRTDIVDEASRVMANEGLDCLRLMECGGAGPWHPTIYEHFWEVDENAKYRIALQAGLWTKEGMRKYLRRHESPWQMEIWGSKRAAHTPGKIWCVNRDLFEEESSPVVPYVPTGIVKGRWNRAAVEPLFSERGFRIDYSQRGWWDPASPFPRSSLPARARKLPKYAFDRIRSL